MKPQEKAKELLDKFIDFAYDEYHECAAQWELNEASKRNAKECAKIAVNEIICAIDWHEFETPNKELEFWNEVLKEIDNL
jgi:hypothetical protein